MTSISTSRNGYPTAFGRHGALHVQGRHLIDSKGNITVLKGLSTHNLSLYPEYINEELFTQFVDTYNISLIRLAMYSAEADDVKGYSDGSESHRKELEDLIVTGVEICAKLGIYCMVDWHILFDYNPNMHRDSACEFFKNITKKLANYDNVIYEICNEPNMNLKTGSDKCTWQSITEYANIIIPVIRENDPSKIIIVGTPVWSQKVNQAADAPLDYDNIMYTLHFYADSHKDELRSILDYALNKDLPVFVSEFGICDASGNGPINDDETNKWLDKLNNNSISYCLWNISNKNETSSIFKPSFTGHTHFESDDLSECGKRLTLYF